jgi:hypothetical protein
LEPCGQSLPNWTGEIELTDRRSDAARSRPAGKTYRIDLAPACPNLEAMLRKGRLGMAGLILLRYGAKSWKCQRRVAARIEASKFGMDIRYVANSLVEGSAGRIYDTLYCARGQGREPDQAAQPSSPAIAPRAARPTPTRCG